MGANFLNLLILSTQLILQILLEMLLAEVIFIFSVNHANGPRKMICLADEAIIYVFMVLSSYSSKDKGHSAHCDALKELT